MAAPSASVMDLVFGYMPAQVMYAAADLRVADLPAHGSRTSRELAEQVPAHEPSLRRLLRSPSWPPRQTSGPSSST